MLLILLLSVQIASASPVFSQTFCEVNAEVLAVNGNTTDLRVVEVLSMSSIGNDEGPSCDDLYLGRTIKDVTLEDGSPSEGEFVNGILTHFDNEFAQGYSLSDLRKIDPIIVDESQNAQELVWPRLLAATLVLLISMTASVFIILKRHRGEL